MMRFSLILVFVLGMFHEPSAIAGNSINGDLRTRLIIDTCDEFNNNHEWTSDNNVVCSAHLPSAHLPLEDLGLELDYEGMDGFHYIFEKKHGYIYALYPNEPYVLITLWYYSTVELIVHNILPHEDGGLGIIKSDGKTWSNRTLQILDQDQPVTFVLDMSVYTEMDFFLLNRIEVTFEGPVTGSVSPSTIMDPGTTPTPSMTTTTNKTTTTEADETTGNPTSTPSTTSEYISTTELTTPSTTPEYISTTELTTPSTTSEYISTTELTTPSTTPEYISTTELTTPSTTPEYISTDCDPTTEPTSTELTTRREADGSTQLTTREATSIASTTTSPTPTPEPRTTTAIEVTTTVDPFCPAGCIATDRYGTTWETCLETLAITVCPGESHGVASWFCTADGNFDGRHPNYSGCSSVWLSEVEEIVSGGRPLNLTAVETLLGTIQSSVANFTYFGHEIKRLFNIGENLLALVDDRVAMDIEKLEKLVTKTFAIFSNILTFSEPWDELSPDLGLESGTTFLSSCDNIAIGLANRYKTRDDNSTTYRKTFGNNEFAVLAGMESAQPSAARITFPDGYNRKQDSYIELPANWIEYFGPENVASFTGMELLPKYVNQRFPADSNSSRKIVNGKLMSFTFDEQRRQKLDSKLNFTENGVRITFRHDIFAWGPQITQVRRKLHDGERAKAVLGSATCVFWDPVNLNWSSDGCSLVSASRDVTVCECNHLTSFALVMDLHDYVGKNLGLEILTWILCPLSIACLILSILVFVYNRFKTQLFTNHPRHDLTLNLCVSLLVANILTLVTMDKNYLHLSDNVCIASAVILHYVFLVTFSWMALEGILLSKLLFIDVFSSGVEHKTIERLLVYLIPAVIVGSTMSINFGRGDHGYGNDAYCWLDGAYLWSFLAPVALVVIFNTVVLGMSIRKSYRLTKNPKLSVKKQAKSASFWIQGSISLTAIMGITWVFGFLMLINNASISNASAYVFTVFNASQGIFIFYFHVASNKKVRSHFKIFVGVRSSSETSPGPFRSTKDSKISSTPAGSW